MFEANRLVVRDNPQSMVSRHLAVLSAYRLSIEAQKTAAPASTAKPAISGFEIMASGDHRLGRFGAPL